MGLRNYLKMRLILILLMLFCTQALADTTDVSRWEVFRATTQPPFRMAFPGPVKRHAGEAGTTYSGEVRPAGDLAMQIVVHATRRAQSAAETDPDEALAIFTSEPDGKLTSKEVVTDGSNSFVLVYSTVASEDGLVVVSLHNVHFIGYNVYDVSYTVIADESISRERLTEAVEKGGPVMKRFQAG